MAEMRDGTANSLLWKLFIIIYLHLLVNLLLRFFLIKNAKQHKQQRNCYQSMDIQVWNSWFPHTNVNNK